MDDAHHLATLYADAAARARTSAGTKTATIYRDILTVIDAHQEECDHVWQPHDAYGENCINCGLWRGGAYDHAETDPSHGGKIATGR